ncbi:hypothetical protein DFP73DRAFT_483884 [Morchella snyderi]|nr:hypothetical protein DFP73DRAFT_483884 [Morchella snyderi]
MTIAHGRQPFEQSSLKLRPGLHNQSASAPPGQLPILASGDSYISHVPASCVSTSASLAELAHLVKLQAYQEHKYLQSRVRLHKSLISSAVSARLTRSGELCHKALVDYFKSDQKSDFATLYNALHDVRNSCEATRRFAMLEPELDSSKGLHSSDDREAPRGLSSFLHEIPAQARDTILSFISMIRSDPSFLASRIGRLSNTELEALVKYHNQSNLPESILPQQTSRRGGSAPRNLPPIPKSSEISPVEKLLSFHRNDPLYTLVHTVFANSSGPDSAEDKRRTDVWSTTCARMICENKGEPFLLVVMDSWAAMREWPAKQNLELTVMGLLQEGAFLVERGDETNAGNSASELRGKHDLLAEEFYIKAEKKLFEVLDDEPGAGGIPEGILELGHAILEKIDDPKKKRHAEIMIIVKWFFNRFLMNGVSYPEYHGIMTGHHISEHARLKILRPVLKKMYAHAVSVILGEWKTSSPVEPVIRGHIESIQRRFRCPRPADSTPVLLPLRAVTSPRETTEVQPFIVLCPADIVTMYQALYPQGSCQVVEGRDIRGGPMSSRSSSRPLFGRSPNAGFEIGSGSVLSSSSSVTSESASITSPLLDQSSVPDDRRSFMSMPSPGSFNMNAQSIYSNSDQTSPEKFGMEVRSAVEAMMGRLGPDTVSGRCHPCAEKWAVVFVSPDGQELSIKQLKHKNEDDDEDDDCGHDSDSEDEGPVEISNMDRVYHQLKDAVMKLVGEYEIPEEPLIEKSRKKFSNRPSAAKANSAPNVPTINPSTINPPESTLDPSNPFHPQSNLTAMITAGQSKAPAPDRSRGASSKNGLEKPKQRVQEPSVLLIMLQAASSQCLARGDYVSSQQYHRALLQARKLPPSLQREEFGALLHIFSRGSRDVIERSASGIEDCEAWFVWLALAQERHDTAIESMIHKVKDLRDKMWYVTDVRNSAAYDEARNVALALKKMGMPQRPKVVTQNKRSNLSHRMSTSSFALLKSDTLIDILAATTEHGGPNKLSDEQASMTFEYLSRYSVENFCKGEERIHRFCLEIDKCVTKLVGDGILDGPVLWSSELFSRDDREMAINRQKGDLYLAGVGTLSVTGDDDDYQETDGRSSSKRGLDMLRRPSTSDLFGRNRASSIAGSFHDGPPSRKGRARSNAGLMDSKEDFLGMPSPGLPSESHNTFWSPFSSHNSASASASGRPKTAHSPTTLSRSPEAINREKRKFLAELKQSLTGLLLSDLGLEVFSQGSETDAWFSGGLGDECIQRKEEQEESKRKAMEKSSKISAAPGGKKGLGRKKSMKNVRKTSNHGTFEALGKDKKGELAAPVATLENVGREAHSGEENSSSSDATARPFPFTATKKGGLLAFPFLHAFKKLLTRFSTHPNPFQKLQAIYELELLIVAMLSSRSPASLQGRKAIPSMPTSPFLDAMGDAANRICSLQLAQPSNIEEAMANLEERRSNFTNGALTSPFMPPSGPRSPAPHSAAPSADMIVDVLQTLFRQAEIRPKTLFRDLQYVAAFVPASILDRTEVGKAFWDTGLAALGLKQDVCRTMVEIADEIVAKDSHKRGSESNKEKGGDYSRYSMQDAATMWNITAKEGDPTAQRELAIFYLTNPTLLPRSTKPLSKPKDTFRPEMMVQKGEDPDKRDPATMCVAYHWMELSAQGGDEVARKYLRSQREEW